MRTRSGTSGPNQPPSQPHQPVCLASPTKLSKVSSRRRARRLCLVVDNSSHHRAWGFSAQLQTSSRVIPTLVEVGYSDLQQISNRERRGEEGCLGRRIRQEQRTREEGDCLARQLSHNSSNSSKQEGYLGRPTKIKIKDQGCLEALNKDRAKGSGPQCLETRPARLCSVNLNSSSNRNSNSNNSRTHWARVHYGNRQLAEVRQSLISKRG